MLPPTSYCAVAPPELACGAERLNRWTPNGSNRRKSKPRTDRCWSATACSQRLRNSMFVLSRVGWMMVVSVSPHFTTHTHTPCTHTSLPAFVTGWLAFVDAQGSLKLPPQSTHVARGVSHQVRRRLLCNQDRRGFRGRARPHRTRKRSVLSLLSFSSTSVSFRSVVVHMHRAHIHAHAHAPTDTVECRVHFAPLRRSCDLPVLNRGRVPV